MKPAATPISNSPIRTTTRRYPVFARETPKRDADVKSFAQKLVDDHTKANGELGQYATAHGVTIPSEMEGKAKEAKEKEAKPTA